jgi:hypothetical protein
MNAHRASTGMVLALTAVLAFYPKINTHDSEG